MKLEFIKTLLLNNGMNAVIVNDIVSQKNINGWLILELKSAINPSTKIFNNNNINFIVGELLNMTIAIQQKDLKIFSK